MFAENLVSTKRITHIKIENLDQGDKSSCCCVHMASHAPLQAIECCALKPKHLDLPLPFHLQEPLVDICC
ncbi:hypothetical protein P3L10_021111 [Capsicum annuum]